MNSFSMPMKMPNLEAAFRDCSSSFADVRWVAAQALATFENNDTERAMEGLLNLCADPVEDVRAQALIGLAEHARRGAPVLHTCFMPAFEDASLAVRTAALECLDVLGDDAVNRVVTMLNDENASIRVASVEALGAIGASMYIDDMAQLLNDEEIWVCHRAAASLAQLKDARGESLLLKMLKEGGEDGVEAALLLGFLGDPKATAALVESAEGWSADLTHRAACAAARINCGDESAQGVLSKMLRAFRWSVRRAALEALAALPAACMIDDLVAVIDRGRSEDASSAIHILANLAEAGNSDAYNILKSKVETLKGVLGEELSEVLSELRITNKKKD